MISAVTNAINTFVPIKKFCKLGKIFFNNNCRKHYYKMHRSYLKFKKNKCDALLLKYKRLKRIYRTCIKRSNISHELKLYKSNNSKKFYSYISKNLSSKSYITKIISDNNHTLTIPLEISEIFNKHFDKLIKFF